MNISGTKKEQQYFYVKAFKFLFFTFEPCSTHSFISYFIGISSPTLFYVTRVFSKEEGGLAIARHAGQFLLWFPPTLISVDRYSNPSWLNKLLVPMRNSESAYIISGKKNEQKPEDQKIQYRKRGEKGSIDFEKDFCDDGPFVF